MSQAIPVITPRATGRCGRKDGNIAAPNAMGVANAADARGTLSRERSPLIAHRR
ncbi:hypothetical protein N802_09290 [Knoellia sinensis KCTC 19936]|uniref:Uncharacterized protein n=1 Tax=Knoellia sinensis KCTC 19936 TaxID=1385520 RepID=A0A0A0IYN8_9MICO|nr:hypothetical protein N802_09290 [Knoellia sinensis KCTC 19936]